MHEPGPLATTNSLTEFPQVLRPQRYFARNVVWNFFGLAAPSLLAVLFTPPLLRNLGIDRFGVLTLAWTIVGYSSLFDFGLSRALTQAVAEKLALNKTTDIASILWSTLGSMLLFGILGTAVLYLFAHQIVINLLHVSPSLRNETVKAVYWIGVTIPIVSTTSALRGLLEAYRRFDLVSISRFFMGVTTIGAPLAAVLLGFKTLPMIMAALSITRFVTLALSFYFCFLVNRSLLSGITFSWQQMRELTRFGGWMTVSNLISPLMVTMDRFIISGVLTVREVTYYATPFEVLTRLLMVPSAISGVLFPTLSGSLATNSSTSSEIYYKSIKTTVFLLFPPVLAVICFSRELITLWLGVGFAIASFRIAQLLIIGVLVNAIATVPFALIQAARRPDLTAKLHMIEFLFYVPLCYVLILDYGITGAAAAWTMRATVDCVLLFFLATKWIPGQLSLLATLLPGVVVLGSAILLVSVGGALPVKALFCSVVLSAYLILLLRSPYAAAARAKIRT